MRNIYSNRRDLPTNTQDDHEGADNFISIIYGSIIDGHVAKDIADAENKAIIANPQAIWP
jgi:hypothetical protein